MIREVRRLGGATVMGAVAGGAACGSTGAIVGLVAAGFVPGITAWVGGGWLASSAIGAGAAALGAVIGLSMSRSEVAGEPTMPSLSVADRVLAPPDETAQATDQ